MEFLLWLRRLRNQHCLYEGTGLIPVPAQWVKHCHELWYRLTAATPIQPLAWKLPYAAGAALKRKKEKKDKTEESGWAK